ncbi:catechol-2,3-dioxygenase [Saccharopolyspora lacisalsi]|uniref:Catechol-2,3-dioxygenase n=1 Tax=Halosaccharopolyspora lacisalsi TaxID=1000566 RepID=A0A839DXW2_9PSEU|nr:catechol-2,3-dioxygenase [Halosaccharopolyspora lacisalsi]
MYQTPAGALLGLRPVAPAGQRFASEHAGLDHAGFRVDSREDLVAARQRFCVAGIPHGEVTDLPEVGLAILSCSDPDGIHPAPSTSLP